MTRRIIAYGGGGFLMERTRSRLDEFFVRATGARQPRICFVGTAAGDAEFMLAKFYKAVTRLNCRPSHLAFFRKARPGSVPLDRIQETLLEQDAIYVGGGNTRAMLAVWRDWGAGSSMAPAIRCWAPGAHLHSRAWDSCREAAVRTSMESAIAVAISAA